ncbi:kallikrein-5-like [Neophocaena asiaeorientalis asiaeorientalis]|uniref:Kallikrein-5-like n=1 Tax=Neophocaena asiaeorientalis asiaeorientalis TaxID=1706337 RepID=A0A341DD68_NEOAA|nr:kallikrein-5-like [Neophocaena asiaeorientalis asiaeorientalis]
MRPRDQWVVITQAGCRERRRRRLQDSGGGAGSGFPTPYLGDVAGPESVVIGTIFLRVFRIRLGHHSLSPIYESRQQLFQGIKCSTRRAINASHCPSAGTSCLASGWEKTSSPQVHHSLWPFPKVLQCLDITVLSEGRCKTAYPNQIDDTMSCAGDQAGRPACLGDRGFPVVCSGSLQGLVSWGDFPCAQPNRPGVYTNLCWFSTWIQDTIQSNA